MEKKLKRDFKERQKIKEEAKLLGKESADMDETHKLKHGDDYRGKIIHEKDRFQDKIHEKESKRNSKNELLQESPNKRKAKQPKIVLKDKETDTPMNKTQDKFVSDHQSVAFTSIANDEITVGERISAPKSIKTEKEISFEEQKAELLKKRKMAEKVRKDLNSKETFQQNEEVYDPLGKDLDNDGIIDRYDNDFRDSDYFESTYDVEDNVHSKGETTQKSEDKPSILGQIRAYQNESKTGEKQTTKEQEYAI